MLRGGLYAALALLTAAVRLYAQPLSVISVLGPQIEAEALQAVLEARANYAALGLGLRKPHLPTVLVLTPTPLELAPYIGASATRTRAFSFAGSDRNYILVGWEAAGSPLRALAHEYAHLVDPSVESPPWFREAFAEYLSYLDRNSTGGFVARTPRIHLLRLRDAAWLPFADLFAAERHSPTFQAPTFYAQAWLVAHWLVARGKTPATLRPDDLQAAMDELGQAALEDALRRSYESVAASRSDEETRPWTTAPVAAASNWNVRVALAEVDRELGRWDRARSALDELEAERPDDPAVAAARGALAMDAGDYDEAEPLLVRACQDPAAEARSHYRLALLLLRPARESVRERAREAASHARQALAVVPRSPDYRLTLAQALMVDEAWESAARELNTLAENRSWRPRAAVELEELIRRRQQALTQIDRPALPWPNASPLRLQPLTLAAVPAPPKEPPSAAPGPMRWPPPGASIVAGRIDFVDCRGPEKIIVMRHPLLTLRFRERKGRPARLFLPPQKSWTEIPCGARGWNVNIAYYASQDYPRVTGEAIAILF